MLARCLGLDVKRVGFVWIEDVEGGGEYEDNGGTGLVSLELSLC